jgi:hypothetical protein
MIESFVDADTAAKATLAAEGGIAAADIVQNVAQIGARRALDVAAIEIRQIGRHALRRNGEVGFDPAAEDVGAACLKGAVEFDEPVLVGMFVVVEEDQNLSPRFVDAAVARMSEAGARFVHIADLAEPHLPADLGGVAGGGIVDHHDLERRPVRPPRCHAGADRLAEQRRTVEGRNDDAPERRHRRSLRS